MNYDLNANKENKNNRIFRSPVFDTKIQYNKLVGINRTEKANDGKNTGLLTDEFETPIEYPFDLLKSNSQSNNHIEEEQSLIMQISNASNDDFELANNMNNIQIYENPKNIETESCLNSVNNANIQEDNSNIYRNESEEKTNKPNMNLELGEIEGKNENFQSYKPDIFIINKIYFKPNGFCLLNHSVYYNDFKCI